MPDLIKDRMSNVAYYPTRPRPIIERIIFSPAIELTAMYMYYIRDCFAGVFRWSLQLVGANALWFLPDAFAFLCMLFFVVRLCTVGKSGVAYIFVIWFGVSIFLSALFFRDTLAVLSGIKMFLPAFVGLCFASRPVNEMKSIRILMSFVFFASVVGVFWNKAQVLPWEGFAYQGLGVDERVAGRVWWQGGERRIGGFAADSTMAGFFLMAGFAAISINARMLTRLFVGVLAISATYVTTSKTNLGAIAVGCAILWTTGLMRRRVEERLIKNLAKLSYVTVLVPFVLVIFLGDVKLTEISPNLYSLQDRINNSWVLPLTYMNELFPVGFILGCGLGCFNYPMDLFPTAVQEFYVPVDNFYYGTYLMFGVPFFFVLGIQIFRRFEQDKMVAIQTIMMNLFAITILCYGPASSLLLFGIIFSDAFANPRYQKIMATMEFDRKAFHFNGRMKHQYKQLLRRFALNQPAQ